MIRVESTELDVLVCYQLIFDERLNVVSYVCEGISKLIGAAMTDQISNTDSNKICRLSPCRDVV